MNKKEKIVINDILPGDVKNDIVHPVRLPVSVPHFVLDDHIETVQDQAESVQKLYRDFVLGKLDPSQLAGSAVYDDPDASEVDPFNHFGVTFEETSQVADQGTAAVAEMRKKQKEAAKKKQSEAEANYKSKLEADIRASIEAEEAAKKKQ